MNALLQGKSILVTGAARGIGLAVAEAIIMAGGKVAMADIDGAEVRTQARRLNAISVEMDVSDLGAVKSGVEQAVQALGTINGLVNNAAILDESHAASVAEARFEKVISTNLTSILRVSQCVLSHFPGQGGSIVNTLSTQALFGQANSVADGTHEHTTGWFRDVYIDRRKLPLGRAGTAQDCAGAFLFLLSDLSTYITGQCIAVDGGLTATY
jgi:3-oxoacyl-[acyl-carrier protein] reductase